MSLKSFMSGEIKSASPVGVINGVEIYPLRRYLQKVTIQPDRLRFVYLSNAAKRLERAEENQQKFPGLYPPNEFNMAILQAVYAKIYALYREDKNPPVSHIKGVDIYQLILRKLIKRDDLLDFIEVLNWGNSPKSVRAIIGEIDEAYGEKGFEYVYYFGGWINSDNVYIKAKRGQIPLRPNTFEAGSLLTGEGYRNIINYLERPRHMWLGCSDGPGDREYMGWSKSNLLQAIKNSGLMRTITPDMKLKGRGPADGKVLLLRDIGIDRDGKVNGIGRHATRPVCYYEALYRKIYETHDYIDWSYLCGKRLVDYHTLKFIAHKDYKMDYNTVKKMKYNEICQKINKIAEERGELSIVVAKSLADVAAIAAPQVILQPTSPWIKPATRSQFIEGQDITDPYQIYQALSQACQDNTVNKQDLIQLTNNLGIRWLLPKDIPSPEDPNIVIRGLEAYSKEQICQYLLERYQAEAEKYEFIAFDCRNPNISKRFIVNAAANMGLGEIIPKDISNLSKEELCEIVNRYINVLRSSKALTRGPSK